MTDNAESSESSSDEAPTTLSRDDLWNILDTALFGLGGRDPEGDRERCKAILKSAKFYRFDGLARRAEQWLKR